MPICYCLFHKSVYKSLRTVLRIITVVLLSRGGRLSELGAVKLAVRRDVDAEDRQPIESWFDDVTTALQSISVETRVDYLSAVIADLDDEDTSASRPSREKPYFATLAVRLYQLVPWLRVK